MFIEIHGVAKLDPVLMAKRQTFMGSNLWCIKKIRDAEFCKRQARLQFLNVSQNFAVLRLKSSLIYLFSAYKIS